MIKGRKDKDYVDNGCDNRRIKAIRRGRVGRNSNSKLCNKAAEVLFLTKKGKVRIEIDAKINCSTNRLFWYISTSERKNIEFSDGDQNYIPYSLFVQFNSAKARLSSNSSMIASNSVRVATAKMTLNI
ncbi:hypothetical protein EPI10_001245 [Gossypium australe]|uniref:Uncharacterized protein n=1 Tax=Gossypium australe TaxID=47621 RepID=A0A5B6VAB4_9ROSI|nr:hypothetical protein EPI10_001245 [Gossypium australe]